jgi:flavorubredoxin
MNTLFQAAGHKNVMFSDLTEGGMVQANQHLIVAGGEALLLDPGGHKVYTKLIAAMAGQLAPAKLTHLFFSHQDPDIVAAANGWLMMTDATAYLSELWIRFLQHFGVDDLVIKRVRGIPDPGMNLQLGDTELKLIPAHFLHSPGNFQVWDPVAKVLYTGDLGASLGQPGMEVGDFDAHVQYMAGFHRRYMASPVAMKGWAAMARTLDIEVIAPQHGALFVGKERVRRFIDWVDGLECGPETLAFNFRVP